MTAPASRSRVLLAPSILSADFGHLARDVGRAEAAGADWIHVDVMDGHFVPNLTIGPAVTAAVRAATTLPVDVHLMIESPARLIPEFVAAGADFITVHQEVCPHLHRVVAEIRKAGARAGVAVNPSTPVELLRDIVHDIDLLLVMTVNPGFGGQAYIATMEPKIAELRAFVVERYLDVDIEVDGGIAPSTIAGAAAAGANMLVAGSALYRDPEGLTHAVDDLRRRAAEAAR
jgi:ribulose-phosphate 3-epimerase